MGVSNGPLNGISNGPGVQGVGMDEEESLIWGFGEDALGKEQRPGDRSGGLKEFSAIGHGCSLGYGPVGRRCWGMLGSYQMVNQRIQKYQKPSAGKSAKGSSTRHVSISKSIQELSERRNGQAGTRVATSRRR